MSDFEIEPDLPYNLDLHAELDDLDLRGGPDGLALHDEGEDDDDDENREGALSPAERNDPRQALRELPKIPHTRIELENVPRTLWEEILAPLHPQQRGTVVCQVTDPKLRALAWSLVSALDMEACQRRNERDRAHHEARSTGFPLPTPTVGRAVARQTVQVNIRLRGDDHERLAQAADAVGLKPTTLARALVLNGAARILLEHAA